MTKEDKDLKLLLKVEVMMIHVNNISMTTNLKEEEVAEVKEVEVTEVVTEDKTDLKQLIKETSLKNASRRDNKMNSTMEVKASILTSKMITQEAKDKEKAGKSKTKVSLDLLLFLMKM